MRRVQLAWAAVPVVLAGLLVWHATREDSYAGDGSSYWETHPDGHAWVVSAVIVDLVAAALVLVSRGSRALTIAGAVVMAVGFLVTGAAALAISAN